MVSIQFKRPRSSLPMNIVKIGVVVLSFVIVGSFLSAIIQLFVGIEGMNGILVTIAILLPGIVLFIVAEDSDFDWKTYRTKENHLTDVLAVFSASALGTGIGSLFADVTAAGSQIEMATLFGIVVAYEVFVYRNRELFPPHVWPWFGSIYFRLRLDE